MSSYRVRTDRGGQLNEVVRTNSDLNNLFKTLEERYSRFGIIVPPPPMVKFNVNKLFKNHTNNVNQIDNGKIY